MFNSIFKIIYFIELAAITTVRSAGTTKFRRLETKEDRSSVLDNLFLALNGVAMILPLFYVFSSWFDFANFILPGWLRWIGVVLFAAAAYLLWLTHRAMGRNWTPTLGMREDHKLVKEGIFRYLRHPMYASHLLWAIAQPLILANWLVGFPFLLTQAAQYWLRIEAEEKMMLDHFGDEYREYMETTGGFFPKF
jgi:protein-S-isoprenylcysteine O-methyltransferase Ste14